jgi:hypothetical protein
MSLFKCNECGCVENTATSGFWFKGDGPALCSECDPAIGFWHGLFPKEDADAAGYVPRKVDSPFIERRPADVIGDGTDEVSACGEGRGSAPEGAGSDLA